MNEGRKDKRMKKNETKKRNKAKSEITAKLIKKERKG